MKKIIFIFAILLSFGTSVYGANERDVWVARFYNINTGEHLYSADTYGEWFEIYNTGGVYGWRFEGRAWTSPKYGEAVFRLYNPALDDHLYTKNRDEVNFLTQRGWSLDFNGQPAFYSGGSVAIYRLYNPISGRHHLTADQGEYNALPSFGWRQEGIGFSAVNKGSH